MLTHSGEKPFECTLCSYKNLTKQRLMEHLRLHTGEKPYVCKVCPPLKFRSQGHVTQHKSVHTTEKPYKCDICSQSFKNKGGNNRHMLVHSGVKSFRS